MHRIYRKNFLTLWESNLIRFRCLTTLWLGGVYRVEDQRRRLAPVIYGKGGIYLAVRVAFNRARESGHGDRGEVGPSSSLRAS